MPAWKTPPEGVAGRFALLDAAGGEGLQRGGVNSRLRLCFSCRWTSRTFARQSDRAGAVGPQADVGDLGPARVQELGDEPRPARLVRRPHPPPTVAVEILVEEE